jgi:hypothetical protein
MTYRMMNSPTVQSRHGSLGRTRIVVLYKPVVQSLALELCLIRHLLVTGQRRYFASLEQTDGGVGDQDKSGRYNDQASEGLLRGGEGRLPLQEQSTFVHLTEKIFLASKQTS